MGRPFVKRGERELLALAFAQRGKCNLLRQNFREVVDDSKRSARIYDMVIDLGSTAIIQKQEAAVLGPHATESSFVGGMLILGAACDIADTCRNRVGNGAAPK